MTPNRHNKRMKIVAILDNLIPSNIIGVVRPMLALQKKGRLQFRLRYTMQYSERDIEWCDAIIFCRNMRIRDVKMLHLAQKHNKKIIYDIDDNFFEIPIKSELGRYHRHPTSLFTVRRMMECASAVRVYSKPMQQEALKSSKNVHLVNSYFDFELINGRHRKEHKKINIVFATSRGPDSLSQLYLPALQHVISKYQDRVEFYCFGTLPSALAQYKNAHRLPYMHNYSAFIRFFYEFGFDIGLAPLMDDTFHNSKTNNKFREYGAMGVAGVYSDTQLYRDCIKQGETGMLADNSIEGWQTALEALITDDALRSRIQENARKVVEEEYSFDKTLQVWEDILEEVQATQPDATPRGCVVDLKLVILLDDDQAAASHLRYAALGELMGAGEIEHEVYSWEGLSEKQLEDCDACIYIASPRTQVAQSNITWLCTNAARVVLVADESPDLAETPANLQVVAAKGEHADLFWAINQINIPGYNNLYNSVVDYHLHKDELTLEESAIHADNLQSAVRQWFFSQDNAVYLWAMFLEGIPCVEKVAPSLTRRIVRRLMRPFGRVLRFLGRVLRRLGDKLAGARRKLVYVMDMVKINLLKRY